MAQKDTTVKMKSVCGGLAIIYLSQKGEHSFGELSRIAISGLCCTLQLALAD